MDWTQFAEALKALGANGSEAFRYYVIWRFAVDAFGTACIFIFGMTLVLSVVRLIRHCVDEDSAIRREKK